jgi:hypothetical protein
MIQNNTYNSNVLGSGATTKKTPLLVKATMELLLLMLQLITTNYIGINLNSHFTDFEGSSFYEDNNASYNIDYTISKYVLIMTYTLTGQDFLFN